MTYLSLGIVGHGSVALAHAQALAEIEGVRITSVAGRDLDRTRRFADRVGANAFTDLRRFAAGLDAAIVASPSADHVDQALVLLAAGVSVLVELPAAPDVPSLDRLIAASRSGARLSATHTARFLPATALVSRVLRDGSLGRLERVTIERTVEPRRRSWTDDPLLHHGQHAIDLLSMWFGPVAIERATLPPHRAVVRGRVAESASFAMSITHEATEDAMRIELEGTDGRLVTDGFGTAAGTIPLDWTDVTPSDAYLAAIATQDAMFVDALCGRGSYPDIAVTRGNLVAIEAVRRAART